MIDTDIFASYFQNNNGKLIFLNIDDSEITILTSTCQKYGTYLQNGLELKIDERGFCHGRHNINTFKEYLVPILKKLELYDKLSIKMEMELLS